MTTAKIKSAPSARPRMIPSAMALRELFVSKMSSNCGLSFMTVDVFEALIFGAPKEDAS